MKQVYEAVDKLDGEITYFFFDGVGGLHRIDEINCSFQRKCSELF